MVDERRRGQHAIRSVSFVDPSQQDCETKPAGTDRCVRARISLRLDTDSQSAHRGAQLVLGLQPVIRVMAVLATSLTVQFERATGDVVVGHLRE